LNVEYTQQKEGNTGCLEIGVSVSEARNTYESVCVCCVCVCVCVYLIFGVFMYMWVSSSIRQAAEVLPKDKE